MNKQYIFLWMIWVILYIIYLIITFSVKEYKINADIASIKVFISDTIKYNKNALETIEYKQSAAYKNMILKEQQSLKNKWEKVIYLTTQQQYNKYTQELVDNTDNKKDIIVKKYSVTDNMTIPDKWNYFLFQKHTY